MLIVHYIENFKQGDLLSDHLSQLVFAESNYAKVKLSKSKREFAAHLNEEIPDIVHIHTCWSHKAYQCMKIAKRKGCFTILSPHWTLSDFSRTKEEPSSKFIKLLYYQTKMVKQIDAVLVTNVEEREEFLKKGWKDRVDYVPAHILNSNTSQDSMAEQHIEIYRKIINTGYRRLMTNVEMNSLNCLLHVGIQQEGKSKQLKSEQLLELRKLNPQQWQRILLYSDDEDVREKVNLGIERLQLSCPDIDTNMIWRYSPLNPKKIGNLNSDKILAKDLLVKNRIEDAIVDGELELRALSIMFANSKYLLNSRKFTLHHLADLYLYIKSNDYDEVKLQGILRKMNIYRFARRLLQILSDVLFLEEGFLPFQPLDDMQTQKLKKNIIDIEKY